MALSLKGATGPVSLRGVPADPEEVARPPPKGEYEVFIRAAPVGCRDIMTFVGGGWRKRRGFQRSG